MTNRSLKDFIVEGDARQNSLISFAFSYASGAITGVTLGLFIAAAAGTSMDKCYEFALRFDPLDFVEYVSFAMITSEKPIDGPDIPDLYMNFAESKFVHDMG